MPPSLQRNGLSRGRPEPRGRILVSLRNAAYSAGRLSSSTQLDGRLVTLPYPYGWRVLDLGPAPVGDATRQGSRGIEVRLRVDAPYDLPLSGSPPRSARCARFAPRGLRPSTSEFARLARSRWTHLRRCGRAPTRRRLPGAHLLGHAEIAGPRYFMAPPTRSAAASSISHPRSTTRCSHRAGHSSVYASLTSVGRGARLPTLSSDPPALGDPDRYLLAGADSRRWRPRVASTRRRPPPRGDAVLEPLRAVLLERQAERSSS